MDSGEFEGVGEGFGDPQDAEDVLWWEVTEDVFDQLRGLEDGLCCSAVCANDHVLSGRDGGWILNLLFDLLFARVSNVSPSLKHWESLPCARARHQRPQLPLLSSIASLTSAPVDGFNSEYGIAMQSDQLTSCLIPPERGKNAMLWKLMFMGGGVSVDKLWKVAEDVMGFAMSRGCREQDTADVISEVDCLTIHFFGGVDGLAQAARSYHASLSWTVAYAPGSLC